MRLPRFRLRTLMLAVAIIGGEMAVLRSDPGTASVLVLMAGIFAALVGFDAMVRRAAGLKTKRHDAILRLALALAVGAAAIVAIQIVLGWNVMRGLAAD